MEKAFDMSPDSTLRAIVATGLRRMEVARELEPDHDHALLIRKLRESATGRVPQQHV